MANNSEKVFYSQKTRVFTSNNQFQIKNSGVFQGTIKSMNKRTNNDGKAYISVDFESIIGDKFVQENFGEEFVNPDHRVTFQFILNGWKAEEIESHRPRLGQYIIAHCINMEPKSFTKKDGSVIHYVGCYGDVIAVGSIKKPVKATDSNGISIEIDENTRFEYAERKPYSIFGADGKPVKEEAPAEDKPDKPTKQIPDTDFFEADEDDPF